MKLYLAVSNDELNFQELRFKLESKLELRLFLWFHRRHIKLVVLVPVDLSSFLRHLLQVLLGFLSFFVRAIEEISTPTKTCRRCKNDEMTTGTNTTN